MSQLLAVAPTVSQTDRDKHADSESLEISIFFPTSSSLRLFLRGNLERQFSATGDEMKYVVNGSAFISQVVPVVHQRNFSSSTPTHLPHKSLSLLQPCVSINITQYHLFSPHLTLTPSAQAAARQKREGGRPRFMDGAQKAVAGEQAGDGGRWRQKICCCDPLRQQLEEQYEKFETQLINHRPGSRFSQILFLQRPFMYENPNLVKLPFYVRSQDFCDRFLSLSEVKVR